MGAACVLPATATFAAGAVVTFLIYALSQRRLRERPELQKAQ
jgi:hypothetical protein